MAGGEGEDAAIDARRAAGGVELGQAGADELVAVGDQELGVAVEVIDGEEDGAEGAGGLVLERDEARAGLEELEHVAKVELRDVLLAADEGVAVGRGRREVAQDQ